MPTPATAPSAMPMAWGGRAQRPQATAKFIGVAEARALNAAASAPGAAHVRRRQAAGAEEALVTFPFLEDDEAAAITVHADTLRDDPARLRSVLAEYGVAIVSGLLTEAECEAAESNWREDLLEVVDRDAATPEHEEVIRAIEGGDGIKAWPGACNEHIGYAWRGFSTHRGLPHGRFAWSCRLHPRVRAAFAAIYGVGPDELCVGLDNVMWQGFDSPSASGNTEWLHCDQNHNTGLTWPIYQGIMYVRPSTDNHVSTTVVWPRSHTDAYERIMADPRAVQQKAQLVKLSTLTSPDGKALHAAAVAGARRMRVDAGSLLLWDSRTTHQGWCGGPRLAQPVCWEPRSRRDEAALRRKLWMCATGVGSSHSSTEGRVHQMAPRKPGRALPGSSPGEHPLRLPLRPTVVPFGVRPDQTRAWRSMQRRLWGSGKDCETRRNADNANPETIRPLLREEVLSAL